LPRPALRTAAGRSLGQAGPGVPLTDININPPLKGAGRFRPKRIRRYYSNAKFKVPIFPGRPDPRFSYRKLAEFAPAPPTAFRPFFVCLGRGSRRSSQRVLQTWNHAERTRISPFWTNSKISDEGLNRFSALVLPLLRLSSLRHPIRHVATRPPLSRQVPTRARPPFRETSTWRPVTIIAFPYAPPPRVLHPYTRWKPVVFTMPQARMDPPFFRV